MRTIRVGPSKTREAASGYIAHYLGFQANTDTSVTDDSGAGNHGNKNSMSTGELWATTSRFASVASASKHVTLPTDAENVWQWNATTKDSLLISVWVKLTLTAGSQNFLGNANGTSEGGMKWIVSSGGAFSINFYDKTNAATVFSGTIFTDASWGSNEHCLTLFMDGANNTFSAYVDGTRYINASSLSTTPILEPTSSSYDFCIGSNQLGATGTAATFFDFHMLRAPSGTTILGADLLARRLYRSPGLIDASEWV